MDKVMSVEERIRRAEEIYNKRNGQYVTRKNNNTKKKNNNVKKLIMQIFVCLLIYLAFYIFNNSDYIFSDEFLSQVKSNFSEDSKIYNIYINIKSFIENKLSTNNEQTVENQSENGENNTLTNNQTSNESIGGAEESIEQKEETSDKDNVEENEKSQMQKDAEEIKKNISFINPIKGTISSTFGWRNPTTSTVPKYHTGLDIAAETGTIISSATDGEVILASSEGDYGNHYKIQTGDVVIIYAHCSKLYLKEGDKVKQGDKIAEVGSTGNSTGPHLHFEIRKDDRLVDPQLILDI